MSKPVKEVSVTLGWSQNLSPTGNQYLFCCGQHGSRLGQSFIGYDAGKHKW